MPENRANLYPQIEIPLNQNPNRLYAVPLLGILIKAIMLIPSFFILLGLLIASSVLLVINAFMVLFTGKYWDLAYNLVLSFMRYSAKVNLFMGGLTDTYPGFDLQIHDKYEVNMPYPQNPNRLFAVPFIGWLIRVILLIPFYIFMSVMNTASSIAVFLIAWVFVLFTGKYPEALHEIYRDYLRLNLAMLAYGAGLSDKYPSFWISMNHKNVKIALIVVAAILMLFQYMGALTGKDKSSTPYPYQNQTLPSEFSPMLDQSSDYQ